MRSSVLLGICALLVAEAVRCDDIQVQQVIVDCWNDATGCIGKTYSVLPTSPWTTSCEFMDPLPAGSKIVSIEAFVWRQYCVDPGSDGSNTLALRLNDTDFPDPYPIGKSTCGDVFPCGVDSAFYELTGEPDYNYAQKNVVTVTNLLTTAPGELKLFEVELDISYMKSMDPQIEARNLSNLGVAETRTLTEQGVVARIPLGATFSLRLTKPGTLPQGLTAQWSTGASTLANGVEPETLFPINVLLEYDQGAQAGEVKKYLAVHEGFTKITVTPTDPTLAKRSITVQVYAPTMLGNVPHIISDGVDEYDLDAAIVRWSHARGVPPQAVKAIMRNETSPPFNTKTWRYEPLSADWDEFSPNGQNKRTLSMFATYRMEYDATHDRGIQLIDSQDVHPRSIFLIDSAAGTRVADADRLVTAFTLFTQNDSWQHWLQYVTAARRNLIVQDPLAVLDWSAQTTLAASYGLMQVLFEESFLHGWPGIGGSRRPYFLFDLPANVNNGGGSIQTGTGLLVSKFKMANSVQTFHDSDAFDNAMLRALSCYNSCNLQRRPITSYGRTAFANMALCMPSEDVSIFQSETLP